MCLEIERDDRARQEIALLKDDTENAHKQISDFLPKIFWILSSFSFIFFIYLIENSKMSQKNIFFFNFYRNFRLQICPVNHTQFYSCYWNHQRLLKMFIWYEKFLFSWLCPEKSLLEPSEVAVFSFKMSYIGHKNGPLRTILIWKLEFFFQDIVRQFKKLPETSHLKKNH